MTRDQMRLNQKLPHVDAVNDGVILALWKSGYDSVEIAKHTGLFEFQIYNRLLHVRQLAKEAMKL